MITVRLNEETCTLERRESLEDFLSQQGYVNPCFAVAVNKQLVPRSEYITTFLNDGDCVEIVEPMPGG